MEEIILTNDIEQIKKTILALSASERASIAHDIILSLDDPSDYILDSKKEKEIKKRIKDIKSGKVSGISASSVFLKLNLNLNEKNSLTPRGQE